MAIFQNQPTSGHRIIKDTAMQLKSMHAVFFIWQMMGGRLDLVTDGYYRSSNFLLPKPVEKYAYMVMVAN